MTADRWTGKPPSGPPLSGNPPFSKPPLRTRPPRPTPNTQHPTPGIATTLGSGYVELASDTAPPPSRSWRATRCGCGAWLAAPSTPWRPWAQSSRWTSGCGTEPAPTPPYGATCQSRTPAPPQPSTSPPRRWLHRRRTSAWSRTEGEGEVKDGGGVDGADVTADWGTR